VLPIDGGFNMAPKFKFTKEEVLAVTIDFIRENGIEALTARELAKKLESSTKVIFSLFSNMKNLEEFERNLGYKFKKSELLEEALTHKSTKQALNNERLEFLGDAVMDLLVAEYLFKKFSKIAEGGMSKLRAALVNEKSFANMSRRLKMGEFLRLSQAEENNGGREKDSILSDAFEAVMGAIYLEAGLDKVREISISLLELCYPQIDFAHLEKDYKTALQEVTQATLGVIPTYELIGSFGPDHKKEFEIALLLNGKEISRAVGSSKKQAQQLAAKIALEKIKK